MGDFKDVLILRYCISSMVYYIKLKKNLFLYLLKVLLLLLVIKNNNKNVNIFLIEFIFVDLVLF